MHLMIWRKAVAAERFAAIDFLPPRDHSRVRPTLYCVELCVVAWNACAHLAPLRSAMLMASRKHEVPHQPTVFALPRQVTRHTG